MNAKTQAEIIIENYGLSTHPFVDGLISTIERAIIAAEEEKAKEEREAWITLLEKRRRAIQDYQQDCEQNTRNYDICVMQITEIDQMISMIRAQSEGEKKGE